MKEKILTVLIQTLNKYNFEDIENNKIDNE